MLGTPADRLAGEKKTSKPRGATKPKRDRDGIRLAMMQAVGRDHHGGTPANLGNTGASPDRGIGLSQRDLEERRWNVSPAIAKERLLSVGLPYEGRRAGLIYSWASIFRAEGIDAATTEMATPENNRELYDDLLDTSEAAELLGYRDASSIRKLVGSGDIPETAYIKFGARGIYRFRPGPFMALRKASFAGRTV